MSDTDPKTRDHLFDELVGALDPPSESLRQYGFPPPVVPDHELLRQIGRGSYGEVWFARNIMGTPRAVKIVFRRSFDHARPYEREFSGIRRFEPVSRTHPSQLHVLHVGRNDDAGYFYYVMELADDASVTPASPRDPAHDAISLDPAVGTVSAGEACDELSRVGRDEV